MGKKDRPAGVDQANQPLLVVFVPKAWRSRHPRAVTQRADAGSFPAKFPVRADPRLPSGVGPPPHGHSERTTLVVLPSVGSFDSIARGPRLKGDKSPLRSAVPFARHQFSPVTGRHDKPTAQSAAERRMSGGPPKTTSAACFQADASDAADPRFPNRGLSSPDRRCQIRIRQSVSGGHTRPARHT